MSVELPTVSRELHSGRVALVDKVDREFVCGQALGLLVPVGYMRYRTSTSGLSTL
jgi:hypothetical protein